MNLKNLSNETLLSDLKNFVQEEKKLIKKVIGWLEEVDIRKVYLEQAYSSMFAFCTEFLGYTSQEAFIRLQAMKLAKSLPEVKEQLQTGELSLTVAAKVQSHIAKENKIKRANKEKSLTQLETQNIITSVKNKTVKSSEILLFERFPHHAEKPPEKAKVISSETIRVEMNLTKETFEMLKGLQSLRAHAHRDQDFENIVRDLCLLGYKKWDLLWKHKLTKSEAVLPIH